MKWVPCIISVVATAGFGWAFLLLLDSGTALDDARSEVARQRERSNQSISIIRSDWVGRPSHEVELLSKSMSDLGVLVGKDDEDVEIGEIGEMIFELKQGAVTNVRYMD